MKRLAGILAIGGGLITISLVTSPLARPTPGDRRVSSGQLLEIEQAAQAIAPAASQVDEQAARLRAKLSQPPARPEPTRNPFTFGSVKGTYPFSTENREKGTGLGAISTPPASPALLLPTLVAITSDPRGGEVFRTAALSMNDDLKIVKTGDAFDRFVVQSIGPEAVTLVDITSPTRATFVVSIR